MKLASTTGDFSRVCATFEERVRHIHNAGFRCVDMSFYNPQTTDAAIMGTAWKDEMYRLKDLGAELGVSYVQAHAPGGNPLQRDAAWDALVESTVRSIACCGILGIPNIVVHAGWAEGIGKAAYFRENQVFFEKLYPAMEHWNVNVLIENSTRANMQERWYFFTGADMKDFLEFAGHPLLHACWDTGHANIEGHQYQDLVDLGSDLYGLHINDNRGYQDEHICPYMGTLNMDEVMQGILDAGFRGPFTFECEASLRPARYHLESRRTWRGSDCLRETPLELIDRCEQLLFATGKYILSAYHLWEQ